MSEAIDILDKELAWDEAIAARMAYELHRQIGNNIGHYRNQTQKEFLAAIRNAIKRNQQPSEPPPAPCS